MTCARQHHGMMHVKGHTLHVAFAFPVPCGGGLDETGEVRKPVSIGCSCLLFCPLTYIPTYIPSSSTASCLSHS
jgi:hypothetical protein